MSEGLLRGVEDTGLGGYDTEYGFTRNDRDDRFWMADFKTVD